MRTSAALTLLGQLAWRRQPPETRHSHWRDKSPLLFPLSSLHSSTPPECGIAILQSHASRSTYLTSPDFANVDRDLGDSKGWQTHYRTPGVRDTPQIRSI